MLKYFRFIFLILLFFFWSVPEDKVYSQNVDLLNIPHLISGPIQGHTTSSSIKIWLLAKEAKQIKVELFNQNEKHSLSVKTDSLKIYDDFEPVTFLFDSLKPDVKYYVSVTLNNNEINDKKMICVKTLSDNKVHDFSFLLGSCAFMPARIFKPFYPQVFDKIFKSMEKTPADFMLWIGDYLYYRNRHTKSARGMYRRQVETRKFIPIDNFLKSKAQYAIWDDHDFGPNDCDASFQLQDSSLSIHKKFWPNPFFGTPEVPGVFSNFRMYDSEFFLTDNRFYRTQPDEKNPTMFGEKQLDWLFQKLKESTAVFKFIVIGSQVLNDNSTHERFGQFPKERQKLFDFIKANKISGVFFLTGDIHHSVLMKSNNLLNYPVYDFTCSPITSPIHKVHPIEYENQMVVKDKIALTYNFGRINITGSENERKCTIEVYNSQGEKLWDYTIHQNELK